MKTKCNCSLDPIISWFSAILGFSAALLLVFILTGRKIKKPAAVGAPSRANRPAREIKLEQSPPAKDLPDDLTLISGIGPVISRHLAVAGVTTFTQLSKMTAAELKELLSRQNLRLNDPTSWPAQAKLAAKGDWESLKKQQQTLKK